MPGSRWVRVSTDAVAVVAIVSFVASFWWDGVVVALFALVLLGVTVPRVARLHGALQTATGVTIIVGAWAATLDWYVTIWWLDLAVHAVLNGLLSVIGILAMRRSGLLPQSVHAAGTVIIATGLGSLLAVLWEIGEWIGYTYITDSIGVGYDDTIGDLAWALIGSLVAGVILVLAERSPDE